MLPQKFEKHKCHLSHVLDIAVYTLQQPVQLSATKQPSALDRVSAGYYISDRTEEILCINMITESEKKDERNSTCNVLPGAGGEQD